MTTTFLVSDTHFGHVNICKFTRDDGSKLRPWDDPNEMDEEMVRRWNSVVKPKDRVYHLGDVVINRKALSILPRLHGRKVLIKGNHDIFDLKDYTPFFDDIRGYHVVNGMMLSHIPIHTESLGRFGTNIHGHLHYRRVMTTNEFGSAIVDPRYYNVSVECIDYTPISLEEMNIKIVEQGGTVGFRSYAEVM